jgi:hypothetical protein
LYEENRFLAFYDFDGIIPNGNVLGCPGATSPWLWLWSEDLAHLWTDPQFVQEAVLGPGTRPLRPLQDVSSEDSSSFAARLGEDSGCIETPASYWGIRVAVSLRAEISYVGAVDSPRPPGWLAAYPWYYPSLQS